MARFEYYINQDERGEFNADVRNSNDQTVWETDGQVFDDGFMRHRDDIEGLNAHLIDLEVMKPGDELVKAN